MTPLNWKDSSQSAASSLSSPWFAVSLGLIGVMIGYSAAGFGGLQLPTVSNPTIPSIPSAPTDPNAPEAPTVPSEPATVDDDPVLGKADAPITLIEFTDYQCPFCGRHYTETYGQIKKDYVDTGKVKIVLRDYPLSFHPFAQKSAEAANCAEAQGKFWEMHDKIFETQATWSAGTDAVTTFKQYAADLKLDTTAFNTCLDSGETAAEIAKDLADGQAAGISGTPGFWILGPDDQTKQISGAYPYETFKAAFDEML